MVFLIIKNSVLYFIEQGVATPCSFAFIMLLTTFFAMLLASINIPLSKFIVGEF